MKPSRPARRAARLVNRRVDDPEPTPSAAEEKATAPPPVTAPGWPVALVVFGVALAVRLAVAAELAPTPLFVEPQLDARELLSWAERIAGGDWRLPSYPTHGFPYPFLLGWLLVLFDGSLAAVRAAQSVLGALTAVVVAWAAAAQWRSRQAGAVAGLLVALYGPLVLVDTMLWEEGLLLFLLSLALLTLVTHAAASAPLAAACGLVLGAATAVRPTSLALLPVALWLVLRRTPSPAPRWRHAVLLLASLALVVVPSLALVSRAAGSFLFLRGFGAINVWIGNDPAGGGVQNARLGGVWDRLEAEPVRAGIEGVAQLERYYLDKSVRRALHDPVGLARVVSSKLVWLTQAEEPRDNHSFAYFREQSARLRRLPGFGLLVAFAAVGLAASIRDARVPLAVLGYLAATALAVLVALAGLRYRLPMVVGWAVLAGFVPVALVERWRNRKRRELTALVALGLIVWGAAHLRLHGPTHRFGEEWGLAGTALRDLGRPAEAERAFQRADELGSAAGADGLGRLRQDAGDREGATRLLRAAVARDPDALDYRGHLGEILVAQGDLEGGAAEWRAALAVNPNFQPLLGRLAEVEVRRGRLVEALELLRRLAAIRRRDARSHTEAARLAGALGRFAEGMEDAERAVEIEPDDPEPRLVLGLLAVEAGKRDEARAALAALESAGRAAQPEVRLLAAAVADLEGDPALAELRLQELLRSDPDYAAARALLRRTAARAGHPEAAERFLAEIDSAARAGGS